MLKPAVRRRLCVDHKGDAQRANLGAGPAADAVGPAAAAAAALFAAATAVGGRGAALAADVC